jgi:hypothetical protein
MAIADRARAFWDRISPRERRLVVVLAIALPITIAIFLGFEISDGLDDMEHRNDRMRQALDVLADLRARGQSHAPTDDVIATMGTEPLDLSTYITNAAKKAKFELNSTITPHPKQTHNGFVISTSSLRLDKLTIDQLKDFLAALETDSKTVAITHLEVQRGREKDQLTVDLDVSTYSKEPPPKPDSGSGSGSGSGTAGSAGKAG